VRLLLPCSCGGGLCRRTGNALLRRQTQTATTNRSEATVAPSGSTSSTGPSISIGPPGTSVTRRRSSSASVGTRHHLPFIRQLIRTLPHTSDVPLQAPTESIRQTVLGGRAASAVHSAAAVSPVSGLRCPGSRPPARDSLRRCGVPDRVPPDPRDPPPRNVRDTSGRIASHSRSSAHPVNQLVPARRSRLCSTRLRHISHLAEPNPSRSYSRRRVNQPGWPAFGPRWNGVWWLSTRNRSIMCG
jgi:hypothetical protein